MPKNALAKRAVTTFAVKATPTIVSHVLGGGELSKVTSSICDTIKKVTCKDRIVLEEAIKALAVMDAPTCNMFMNLLYDSIQVYVQSDCKDYSRIVEWLIVTPNATPEAKVQYALMLKQQQHDQWVEKVKVVTKGVVTVTVTYAVKEIGTMFASQAPKILENQDKADKRDEDRKRKELQEDANAARHARDLDADAKRRNENFQQERERWKADEERRKAGFAREQERRKADEARRQADFARQQEEKQAHFAREQERRKAEAQQRAQNK